MSQYNNQSNGIKNFFEQKAGKKLTDIEAVEYKSKLVQFFSLLVEIDQKNKRGNNENKDI